VASRIGNAVADHHGFQPHVLILNPNELQGAVASNPFRAAETVPKSLHLYFLSGAPKSPDLKSMHGAKSKNEAFALTGRILYLTHAGRLRKIEIGRARRAVARCGGHGSQLADGFNPAQAGEGV
jgi:uncharacterized protein (DUF1697 family)